MRSPLFRMDALAYLQRIGYAGPLDPTPDTLRDLHLAHLYTVPYENLDIPLGRPIQLEVAWLFEKIVVQRRGGFCYELNGLFAALLEQLGFNVTRLSGSAARKNGAFAPDFDHMVLHVSCPGDLSTAWLADVGWGDTFCKPLRFEAGRLQVEGRQAYRVDSLGDGFFLVCQRDEAGVWERQFRFDLPPRQLADFVPMCVYHQTSPDSIFTRQSICSRATLDGRITLSEDRLIVTQDGQRREEPVEGEEQRRKILLEQFGITLPA